LLPQHHLIRKSVIGNYATWLMKTGGDKNLIASLKSEIKAALGAGTEDSTEKTASSDFLGSPSTQGVLISRGEQVRQMRAKSAEVPHSEQSFQPETPIADRLSNEIETSQTEKADKAEIDADDKELDFEFRRSDPEGSASDRVALPLSAYKTDNENNSGLDWSDLPIRGQSAMRGSARSYFKTQSTAELDKAVKDENSWSKRLMRIFPLAICAVVFALFVTSVVNEPSSKNLPPFYEALVGKKFDTTDGSLSITVSRDGLMIMGQGLKKKNRPVVWRGSFSDELRLLRGEFDKCIWITLIEQGLQDPSGLKFWDETSKETNTVRAMYRVAAGAQSFYQNNHRYPLASEAKALFTYFNPCTNKNEPVHTYTFTTYTIDSKVKDKRLEGRMLRGGSFEQETSPAPGSVAMLCVTNKPNGSVELPNQPIESQYAYLHAYDQNGQMIVTPTSGKPLVLSLGKGITERPEDKSSANKFANVTLAIAQGAPPSSALVLLKYVGCFLLVVALIAYLLWIKATAVKE
ncbi:MAG: hypothetical protein IT342_13030, partial [Candidatus Melainabacteria bacterium]|nr:hypothetical protein [Candidatus Melainabacteria bacterium]